MFQRWFAILAAVALAGAACAATPAPRPAPPADPAGPLPISAFYKDPAISAPRLSPDGKWLAVFRDDGDKSAIVVLDIAAGASKVISVNSNKNLHFQWIRWKGDDRLVIGATLLEIDRVGGKPDGEIYDMRYGRFMIAMDRDGGHVVELLNTNIKQAHLFGYSLDLLDVLKTDPDHILAAAPTSSGVPAVWLADIKTGEAKKLETGDTETFAWDTDSAGHVVARFEQRGRDAIIMGRAPGETSWSEVVRVRPKDLKALQDFQILQAAPGEGRLYVAVKPETTAQGSARTVRIYDFKTHSLGPPLWPALSYDVSDIVTDDDNQLLGVCYWVDVYQCDFKDKDVQANFRGIAKYFQGDRSMIPVSRSDDGHWWLFRVSGPDDPTSYFLYDWKAKTMEKLGSAYPALPAAKLGTMQRFTYKARDGTDIHAYLTRPPGAPGGPLPLVVLPHGGPEARDDFDYDPWSQIIATRGYLVFQPNYRGSGGYGVAYAEAGYGQWGDKIQDDILDGVKQLIASGQADPSRICIFGASFGGYSALIGGAQHPELYKCVVSWAGVSDLGKMVRVEKGGLFVGQRSPAYDYDLKAIGDPDADKDRLARTSAITYAKAYVPPVLLIHGDSDTNVPPYQSQDMNAALKNAGKSVRLVIVKGEDHTGWDPDHEQAAITDVVDFITTHIAPAKLAPVLPPSSDAATASNDAPPPSAGGKPARP